MRIEITKIDKSSTELVADGKSPGFKGCFRCSFTEGSAIFVPYSDRGHDLEVGNLISVETGQASVSGFEVLPVVMPHQMVPLSQPGDYDVIGTVNLNGDDEVFYIDVDDFSFSLDINDTGGLKPLTGHGVRFTVHGMLLYDENL